MPTVEIEVNSSVPNDELIAHRVSLIPSRNCDGDNQCEFCSIEFHLCTKCLSYQTLDVTSKDLYSSKHTVVSIDFSDPNDPGEQRLFCMHVVIGKE